MVKLTQRQTEVMAMIEKDRMVAVKYRRTVNSLITRGLIFPTGEETNGMIVCGMVKAKVEQSGVEVLADLLSLDGTPAKVIRVDVVHDLSTIKRDRDGNLISAVVASSRTEETVRVENGQAITLATGDTVTVSDVRNGQVWTNGTDGEHLIGFDEIVSLLTSPLTPVTFDDVKEANGWMGTDIATITRRLPAGTEVKPGFWNCCMGKPVIAVQFVDGQGNITWRASCAADASTVPADRLARLPESLAEYDARTMADRAARTAAEQAEMNADDGYRETEEQASAGVPVIAALTGDQILAFRESALIRAYVVAARSDGRMQLTRAFKATIAKFNKEYGHTCKTWADVRAVLIAAGVKGVKP